jgi:hypothetical protein
VFVVGCEVRVSLSEAINLALELGLSDEESFLLELLARQLRLLLANINIWELTHRPRLLIEYRSIRKRYLLQCPLLQRLVVLLVLTCFELELLLKVLVVEHLLVAHVLLLGTQVLMIQLINSSLTYLNSPPQVHVELLQLQRLTHQLLLLLELLPELRVGCREYLLKVVASSYASYD